MTEKPKVIAWCPKHDFMRNHTDAAFLCRVGQMTGQTCGQGEYRIVLPDPVDVFGRPLEKADHELPT